jgi:hypothetical protein
MIWQSRKPEGDLSDEPVFSCSGYVGNADKFEEDGADREVGIWGNSIFGRRGEHGSSGQNQVDVGSRLLGLSVGGVHVRQ